MKLLKKIAKIISAAILIPTISMIALILFYSATGKEFKPIKSIFPSKSDTQLATESEVESESAAMTDRSEASSQADSANEAQSLPAETSAAANAETLPAADVTSYVLNMSTMEFHDPSCTLVAEVAPENYSFLDTTKDEVLSMGYTPCKNCNP